MATARSGGFISVWDIVTGEKLIDLGGQSDTFDAVALTPDGQWLITGGIESTTIWDLATGTELVNVTLANSWRFTKIRDGRRLYAADFYATTVGVYTVFLEDVVALAESRLTRSLTTAECQEYHHVAECPSRP